MMAYDGMIYGMLWIMIYGHIWSLSWYVRMMIVDLMMVFITVCFMEHIWRSHH